MKLCIDAGPTENRHRYRGIGTVARSLIEAASCLDPQVPSVDLSYLARRPLPNDRLGRNGIRWARRGWTAEVSDTNRWVPYRISKWTQPLEAVTTLAYDVAVSGANVFLATDPNAVPTSRRFQTVAILYDVVPLLGPDVANGPLTGLDSRLYWHRLNRLRRSDHQIAISQSTKRDAVRVAGFNPDHVSVVPLAVDRTRFRPIDQEAARQHVRDQLGVDAPYFLFVGTCDRRKNVATLLEAYAKLSRGDAVLVMAGSRDGSESLRATTQHLGIADRVRWLDVVPGDDLPQLYAGATAFVFPTIYEGFGLPILEAMSCGAPVITTRGSAVPEVAGDAARYIDPHSPADIATAMQEILDDDRVRADLRARGVARAATFSWERSARMAIDVCTTVHRGAS